MSFDLHAVFLKYFKVNLTNKPQALAYHIKLMTDFNIAFQVITRTYASASTQLKKRCVHQSKLDFGTYKITSSITLSRGNLRLN